TDFVASARRVPADDAAHQELLRELVKIDLEYRWRLPGLEAPGPLPTCPRLEDYVAHLAAMGPLAQVPVELYCEDYRVRNRWGDRPGHAEDVGRYPRRGSALLA